MKTTKAIYQLILFFVLIATLLVVFLIYPTFNSIKRGSMEILLNRGQIIFSQLENRQMVSFKKELSDYQANFAKASQLFVDSKNPINFIKFLEKIASDSKMTSEISLISTSSDVNVGPTPKQFFKIHARGKFADALLFIKKIETGQYLITIDGVHMKKFNNFSQEQAVGNSKKNNSIEDIVDLDISLSVLSAP